VVDPIASHHGVAGDLVHVGTVTVTTDEDRLPAQFRGLLHDEGHFLVEKGHGHGLGAAVLHVRELRTEVHVTTAEGFVRRHRAAESLEGLHEILGKPFRIVTAHVADDRGLLDTQLVEEIFRHDLALIGVGEADAEGIRPCLSRRRVHRDGGIRGETADLGNLRLGNDGVRGNVEPTEVRAADGDHLVLLDKTPGRIDGILRTSADIVDNEFQGTSEHAACGVDLLDGENGAVPLVSAPRGGVTRQVGQIPDLDGVRGEGRGGEKQKAEGQDKNFLHHQHGTSIFRKHADGIRNPPARLERTTFQRTARARLEWPSPPPLHHKIAVSF